MDRHMCLEGCFEADWKQHAATNGQDPETIFFICQRQDKYQWWIDIRSGVFPIQEGDAVSVAVSAWTLVAISVERYYAICHPLTSRRWQTLSHAYKIIAIVWTASLICMSPIAFVSLLQPIRKTGRHKCREEWPTEALEKTYTVFLDIILLVLPLLIMAVKYGCIINLFLHKGGHDVVLQEQSSMLATSGGDESLTPAASPRLNVTNNTNNTHSKPNSNSIFTASFRRHDSCSRQNNSDGSNGGGGGGGKENKKKNPRMSPLAIMVPTTNAVNSGESGYQETSMRDSNSSPISPAPPGVVGIPKGQQMNNHLYRQSSAYGHTSSVAVQTSNPAGVLRRCNQAKSLKRKKRVIKMLGFIVLEFFCCWAPLYVMNTWYLFSPTELYDMIGHVGVSLIQLLAYISCCCNPITLCVMSRGFRIAFCHVFGCHCDSNRHSASHSQRNDSVRLTRNRSLYTPTFNKTTDHV
ncbi:Cholecystokinin receptor [Folsomia candida]|uniref:Cholecystokinin receptor n=1 Tax=Folsomia candida TaxID=158441 RepID=A0A226E6J7_FOLCA|nr:Cholecystokinin receptor [Folsomia candida]